MTKTTYEVQVLRSGQPRAYADTEREYLITVLRDGKPWLMHQDVPSIRPQTVDWAKAIVRALCQPFRETGDDDGREGMEAHFYPTLKSLSLNSEAGTIRALIIEPYTD